MSSSAGASAFVSSPRGQPNKVVPPALAGEDQSKLAAIMARQRQASEANMPAGYDEVTIEEVIDDTDHDDVVEEVIEEDRAEGGEQASAGGSAGGEAGEETNERKEEQEENSQGDGPNDDQDHDDIDEESHEDAAAEEEPEQEGEDGEEGDEQEEEEEEEEGRDEEEGDEDEEEEEEEEVDEELDDPDVDIDEIEEIDDGDDVGDGQPDLEGSGSEMSVEEFDKDNPNVAQAAASQTVRATRATRQPIQQQPSDPDLEEPDAAVDVDDQTPQDGYGGSAAGLSTANDPFDQGSLGQYSNDQFSQREKGYDEDAAFGTSRYSQSAYTDDPQERFEDEEQPLPPANGYDPRVSKARTVDSFAEHKLCLVLGVACVCLAIVFAVVVVILVLWQQDQDDETPGSRSGQTPTASPTISSVPSLSPAPSIPPVPTAAQPVTARLSQTEQSSEPGLGTSLAMSGDYMVLGDPNVGNGQVLTFSRSGSSTDFTPVAVAVSNSVTTELFGAAIDMVTRSNGDLALLVGATRTRGTVVVQSQDVINVYGSAHYFTYDGSSWVEIGGPIRGSLALEETGGLFGQAVAMASDVQRVVVSAPSSSSDFDNLNTGKVYTYRYDGQSWDRTASVLQGSAESYTGTSLAMSNDGSRLLIGAPGSGTSDGQFSYHEWTGSDWETVIVQTGPSSSSFGTSLAFLDRDVADSFVVGGPTANSGEGVVIAYIESMSNSTSSTSFVRYGDPIRGAPGEGIGKIVCGRGDLIAFGTNDGTMKLYQFNGGDWSQVGSVSTGTTTPTDCSISDDISRISVGTGERVRVYELLKDGD